MKKGARIAIKKQQSLMAAQKSGYALDGAIEEWLDFEATLFSNIDGLYI